MRRDDILKVIFQETLAGKTVTMQQIIRKVGCSDGPVRHILPRLEKQGIIIIEKKRPMLFKMNEKYLKPEIYEFINRLIEI